MYERISRCILGAARHELTTRNHNPDEIYKEVVAPEVDRLRTRPNNVLIVQVEHAGSIVKDQTVHLADAYQGLHLVAERIVGSNEIGCKICQWTPHELNCFRQSRYIAT